MVSCPWGRSSKNCGMTHESPCSCCQCQGNRKTKCEHSYTKAGERGDSKADQEAEDIGQSQGDVPCRVEELWPKGRCWQRHMLGVQFEKWLQERGDKWKMQERDALLHQVSQDKSQPCDLQVKLSKDVKVKGEVCTAVLNTLNLLEHL